MALRSIFGTLKARNSIFVNPIARSRLDPIERRIPLPLELAQLRDALTSSDPAQTAIAALLVFHGLRPAELRTLHLTDVRDGRIYRPGRTLPLADAAKRRVSSYLDLRNRRWPSTVNPHLFITKATALASARSVDAGYGSPSVWLPTPSVRILNEAIATGGDVRRLCDFFGITVAAALHYTTILGRPDLDGQS